MAPPDPEPGTPPVQPHRPGLSSPSDRPGPSGRADASGRSDAPDEPTPTVEDLLRGLAPRVLGTLLRRFGQFDLCEDAVQEALLAAATGWPTDGVPANPRGWLTAVATRRMIDQIRADSARRRREDALAAAGPASELVAGVSGARGAGAATGPDADADLDDDGRRIADRDDSLRLLFLCCHPALSAPSQIALTLRAVGGLSTAQIAAAFLVPESTMAQRISRAKQSVRAAGAEFRMPASDERDARLRAVMQVLYLIFNEGYTATSGPDLTAPALSGEAIRLTRWLARLVPDDPEVLGLLALMLLTDARRPARTDVEGRLVPLTAQDRTRWDHGLIAEGVALVERALPTGPLGVYQLQAAIAAVHDEAPDTDATDWPQILGLYDLLERIAPNPMVTLNRAVALARVAGPAPALALLCELAADRRMATNHRLLAVRAHLHDLAGDRASAEAGFRAAARRTTSIPERQYLLAKAHEAATG